MSALSDALAQYKAEVNFHGISDLWRARIWSSKVIWLVAIAVALVLFVQSLVSLTVNFAKDEASTLEQTAGDIRIPPLLFCPDPPLFRESVTKDEHDYLKGFFPVYNAMFYGDLKPEINDLVLANKTASSIYSSLATKYQNSMETMIKALSKKEIANDKWSFPKNGAIREEVVLTVNGQCFMIGWDILLDDKLMEYATFSFWVNATRNTSYSVYVGDRRTTGIQPSPADALVLEAKQAVSIRIRSTRRKRYPGRGGSRCKNYEKSDYRSCCMKNLNSKCQATGPGCRLYIPSSSNTPETKVVGGDRFCNIEDRNAAKCVSLLLTETKSLGVGCALPCIEHGYDTVLRSNDQRYEDAVSVVVGMDNPFFSKHITEYSQMTPSQFAAAVGGTAGLFFGASILSFVQILVCCLNIGTSGKKQGNVTQA